MIKEKERYDFAIIGSGLGGLECAYILASEGYRVIVLEKNRQLGGSLQVFSRNKLIFDTGVHYIGGLDKGQNLYQFFKYFGLIDSVQFKKLDVNGFDRVKFKGDDKMYMYGQGYENFMKILIKDFPEEKEAIKSYCLKMQEIANEFPMYNLSTAQDPNYYEKEYLTIDTAAYLQQLTSNTKLQNVLAGTKLLYGGVRDETPLYVHALIVNSFIISAYRCIDGGSKIANHLGKKIRHFGGNLKTRAKVVSSTFKEAKMDSVILESGEEIFAKNFISNIAPEQTIAFAGKDKFKNAYINRLSKLKKGISSFSLHLSLKKNTIKYNNFNIYYFEDEDVWSIMDYNEETWPKSFMISMPYSKNTNEYSEVMSIISYMHYDEVKQWEDSFKTDATRTQRAASYLEWKKEKEQKIIQKLEAEFYPNLSDNILQTESSTPLTYRDYIGNSHGAMYGNAKTYKSPIKNFVNTRTKVPNLFLTGQYLNLHGVLGVTVSAFITCFEFVDKEKLIAKVKKINAQDE